MREHVFFSFLGHLIILGSSLLYFLKCFLFSINKQAVFGNNFVICWKEYKFREYLMFLPYFFFHRIVKYFCRIEELSLNYYVMAVEFL